MPQSQLSNPPRPRPPVTEAQKRYRCTNCGIIVELASTAGAACRECGHTRFCSA